MSPCPPQQKQDTLLILAVAGAVHAVQIVVFRDGLRAAGRAINRFTCLRMPGTRVFIR